MKDLAGIPDEVIALFDEDSFDEDGSLILDEIEFDPDEEVVPDPEVVAAIEAASGDPHSERQR